MTSWRYVLVYDEDRISVHHVNIVPTPTVERMNTDGVPTRFYLKGVDMKEMLAVYREMSLVK